MIIEAVLLAPLLGALPVAIRGFRSSTATAGVFANFMVLVGGVVLATRAVHGDPATALGVFRVDALSAFMVIVIGTLAILASWMGIRTISREIAESKCTQRQAILYAVLVQGFAATMLVAVTAANMGVVWVGIEATTIVTTFLVGHRRTTKALEASWKYIVICSVGIAIAFLGTVLFYFASIHGGSHPSGTLDWTSLRAHANRMNTGVIRLGFALVLLGYGTKVGLVPMHSWLPDAHSQAPAPVSALMSGVLLTVAFYAILRFKAITDAVLGTGFSRGLLVLVSLLSLVLAASLLISQRDYKRMLAYHSIEHMGLIALGAAAGLPLALAGALLHILGHGLAKAVLFLTSGEILAEEGTAEIHRVRTLLSRRPTLGGIFGVGLFALLGFPPFSLFTSELLMFRGELQAGLGWAVMVAVAAMVVIFFSVAGHARHMLLGDPADGSADREESGAAIGSASPASVTIPLISGLAACVAIGVAAWPLSSLLHAAAAAAR